jgi:hypothetical protein
LDHNAGAADLTGHSFKQSPAAPRQADPGALLGEGQSDGAPNAGGGAGDNRNLILEAGGHRGDSLAAVELLRRFSLWRTIEEGFGFLGQNIRRYPHGKLFIKPAQNSVASVLSRVKETVREHSVVPPIF